MVGLAVRYDALDRNLVRDVGRIESEQSAVRALSVAEAVELREKIHANPSRTGQGRRSEDQAAQECERNANPGLSGWAVAMLRRRREQARPNEWGVVFTAPGGELRDPSNTQADLRVAFAAVGYGWVTSHIYRPAGGRQARPCQGVDDTRQLLRPEGRAYRRGRPAEDLRRRTAPGQILG